MKHIIELQHKSGEMISDIKDILYATSINFKALIVESSDYQNSNLKKEFQYLDSLITSVQQHITNRSELHMNYLITKQIQEEEEKVRRQRLTQYEQKIYDQRRIIADKEIFFQSLLRPKRKRKTTQAVCEFQETRAREIENQQRNKIDMLYRQVGELQALKRMMEQQERSNYFKRRLDLQSTKTCSISNLNITNNISMAEPIEITTEKIIPLDDKITIDGNKQNLGHTRTVSLQHAINREPPSPKIVQEGFQEQRENLISLFGDINNYKIQNEELSKIYEQECLAIGFKRSQNKKLMGEYQKMGRELERARERRDYNRTQHIKQYERCYNITKQQRKVKSIGKN